VRATPKASGRAKPAGASRRIEPARGNAGAAVTGLSHIAIATAGADALAQALAAALGAERGAEEVLDGGALRLLFVRLGPVTLELIEPRSPDHTVARFLAKRGPGLHHVSLEVPDLERMLERCRAAGVEVIDGPRPGAHGTRVAFLHPKSLSGVLLELCERPRRARRQAARRG
jgi:methylmalonyl-CoA epimerase